MITCDVYHFCILARHTKNLLDHRHMGFRKIALIELPNVNDVAIQYQGFRFDAF
jgi:hypothetical protein